MSCEDAGTCGQEAPATPQSVRNRPGLASLARRVGTHARFKLAMLRALSAQPALRGLTIREDGDPAIGLADAWAAALDVLTFYQERLADEGYLGTAKERRSALELARAIGYEPGQGVAATAWLAFTVELSPGAPQPIVVAAGQKVQSIPGPGELPQMFETAAALAARVELNRLRPRLRRPQVLGRRSTSAWLAGTSATVKPGDLLLFVGRERHDSPLSERWDVRIAQSVASRPEQGAVLVTWTDALGHESPLVDPAQGGRMYVFRRRASLFGHNAPDWRGMPLEIRKVYSPPDGAGSDWPGLAIRDVERNRIDLDAAYPDILQDSWVLLEKPSYTELYRAVEVATGSRTNFTLTGKSTRITLDARRHLTWFPVRDTVVHAASELLPMAESPVAEAVWGDRFELEAAGGLTTEWLEPGRRLILRGRPLEGVAVGDRSRSRRRGGGEAVEQDPPLTLATSAGVVALVAGERLSVLAPPSALPGGMARWRLRRDADGAQGELVADADDLIPLEDPLPPAFAPPDLEGMAAEAVEVSRFEAGGLLVLKRPLERVYQRASVEIFANVVLATHGDTRREPLGSGDGSAAMQAFALRQKPVTYVSDAEAPGGAASTIQVRVDGVAWDEVPTLYGQEPAARAFSVRHAEDGTAVIQFGDGKQGSRLPAGSDNVEATYRIGVGLAGQVRARQLALLISRPLGLKEVTNPLPAAGAEDSETLDGVRRNAPLTVLTLDRIVSVSDAEDFARSFAGVGKAQAAVLWNGDRRMIHLSLAGADGAPLDPQGELAATLRQAIARARPADQEIQVAGYEPVVFDLEAGIAVDPAHGVETVLAACLAALRAGWSFEARGFGQGVTVAELAAVLHAVPGVQGATLSRLNGRDATAFPRLPAASARWDAGLSRVLPAQLLILDPDAVILRELSA